MGKEKAKDTLAYQALEQIGAIFKLESAYLSLTPEERANRRQTSVKPLVDAFFEWIRANRDKVPPKSETGKGFTYCLNQELYLKVFLNDGQVPADNNAAEQAIRGFCIGKRNWHLIDTVHGAQASAVIYSIAETAKANRLKPYQYFEHLLTEIPKHMDGASLDFLEALLPWSKELPESCRKPIK
ncbi:transposase [Clostridium sp. AN503]|uniref:IS66 family transposase n=1 Tax=Clostridium sp. AN503 TaxID=3160598 RepID=UPI00345772F5